MHTRSPSSWYHNLTQLQCSSSKRVYRHVNEYKFPSAQWPPTTTIHNRPQMVDVRLHSRFPSKTPKTTDKFAIVRAASIICTYIQPQMLPRMSFGTRIRVVWKIISVAMRMLHTHTRQRDDNRNHQICHPTPSPIAHKQHIARIKHVRMRAHCPHIIRAPAGEFHPRDIGHRHVNFTHPHTHTLNDHKHCANWVPHTIYSSGSCHSHFDKIDQQRAVRAAHDANTSTRIYYEYMRALAAREGKARWNGVITSNLN